MRAGFLLWLRDGIRDGRCDGLDEGPGGWRLPTGGARRGAARCALPLAGSLASLGVLLLVLPARAGLAMDTPESESATPRSVAADSSVAESSGAARVRIPIEILPGTGGFRPLLGFEYSSDARDGALGAGWRLPLSELGCSRRFGVPPSTAECEAFELDGELLVGPLPGSAPAEYRTFVESFQRVVWSGMEWIVTDTSGTRHRYGIDPQSRVHVDDDTALPVRRWLLAEQVDVFGNRIRYAYDRSDEGAPVVESIRYGYVDASTPTREIRFVYEPRPDAIRDFSGGVRRHLDRRLQQVWVLNGSNIHSKLLLEYTQGADTHRSLLAAIVRYGTDCPSTAPDSHPVADGCLGLPAREFDYTDTGTGPGQPAWREDAAWDVGPLQITFPTHPFLGPLGGQASRIDVDGDGLTDIVHDAGDPDDFGGVPVGRPLVYLNLGSRFEAPAWSNSRPDNASAQWTDRLQALTFDVPRITATLAEATGSPDDTTAYDYGICAGQVAMEPGAGVVRLAPQPSQSTPSVHATTLLNGQDPISASPGRWIQPAPVFRAVDLNGDGLGDLVASVRLSGFHASLSDCGSGTRLAPGSAVWVPGQEIRIVFRNTGDPALGWERDRALEAGLPLFGIVAVESPEFLDRRMRAGVARDPVTGQPVHPGVGAHPVPFTPQEGLSHQWLDGTGPCTLWGLGGLADPAWADGILNPAAPDFCFNPIDLMPRFVDMNGDGLVDIVATLPDALPDYEHPQPGDRDPLFVEPYMLAYPVPGSDSNGVHRYARSSSRVWLQRRPADASAPSWELAPDFDLPIRHGLSALYVGTFQSGSFWFANRMGLAKVRGADTGVRLLDLNRDGLTDVLWANSLVDHTWEYAGNAGFMLPTQNGVLLNTGRQTGSPGSAWCTSRPLPGVETCAGEAARYELPDDVAFGYIEDQLAENLYMPFAHSTTLGDANGDGWVDLIVPQGGVSGWSATHPPGSGEPTVYLHQPGRAGSVWERVPSGPTKSPFIPPAVNYNAAYGHTASFGGYMGYALFDVNGDRVVDMIESRQDSPTATFHSYVSQVAPPDLLREYRNGRGGVVQISYQHSLLQRDAALERDAAADAAESVPPVPSDAGIPVWNGVPSVVVSSITVDGPARERATTHYTFSHPRWCPDHRSHLGFRLLETTRPDGSFAKTYFYQEHGRAGRLSRRELYDTTGTPLHLLTQDWELPDPATVVGGWGGSPGIEFARIGRLVGTTSQYHYGATFEEGAVGATRATALLYDDDVHGHNFVKRRLETRPTGVLRTERVAQPQDPDTYLIGRPQRITQYGGASGWDVLRDTEFSYHDALSVPTHTRVAKRRVWDDPRDGSRPGRWIDTKFAYDGFGNRIERREEGPTLGPEDDRVTRFCYDGDEGAECSAGHGSHSLLVGSQDPLLHWTTYEYESEFARPTRVASQYADEPTVTRSYDPYGRLVGTALTPEGATAAVEIERIRYADDPDPGATALADPPYRDVWVFATASPDPSGSDSVWSRAYEDGLGGIWKRVNEVDGGRFSGSARYEDPSRRIARTTYELACSDASCPSLTGALESPATELERDAAGRVLRVTLPSDRHTTRSHAADSWGHRTLDAVLEVDPNGNATRRLVDGDRLVLVEECLDADCSTPDRTEYDYVPSGELRTRYDPVAVAALDYEDPAHRIRYTHDTLGRITRQEDPDAGTLVSVYDSFGNLASSHDDRGLARSFLYDALDRPASILTPAGEDDVSFSYRASPPVKQPAVEATASYTKTFAYDALGRRSELAQRTTGSQVLLTSYRHDLLGRAVEVKYPIATDNQPTVTRYEYEGAYLKRVCDVLEGSTCAEPIQTYVADVLYDAIGRRKTLELPGGSRTFEYDGVTHHLLRDRFDAGSDSSYWIEHLYQDDRGEPAYDAAGNLLQLRGSSQLASPDFSAKYTYDERNRLATWEPASGLRSYGYDALGNLVEHAGAAQLYDDPARPHAIQERSDGAVSYEYDARGNVASIASTATGATRHYGFDSANRLLCVGTTRGGPCDTLSVVYDASGARLREVSPGASREFVGDDFVWELTGARVEVFAFGERVAIKKITGGAPRIASSGPIGRQPPHWLWVMPVLGVALLLARTAGVAFELSRDPTYTAIACLVVVGLAVPRSALAQACGDWGVPGTATYRWVMSDRIGSGLVEVDASGDRMRHVVFRPFGGVEEEAGTRWRDVYAGHPLVAGSSVDGAGLAFMKARWYDPAAGRFLSVDPVLDMTTPQTLNAYGYVANNPVNFADPSGAYFAGCPGTGCSGVLTGGGSYTPARTVRVETTTTSTVHFADGTELSSSRTTSRTFSSARAASAALFGGGAHAVDALGPRSGAGHGAGLPGGGGTAGGRSADASTMGTDVRGAARDDPTVFVPANPPFVSVSGVGNLIEVEGDQALRTEVVNYHALGVGVSVVVDQRPRSPLGPLAVFGGLLRPAGGSVARTVSVLSVRPQTFLVRIDVSGHLNVRVFFHTNQVPGPTGPTIGPRR